MTDRNPYPGLRPFQEDDAEYFFGRESEVDDLVARLGRQRFAALTGNSGCGKSSLIRAGLLPALQAGSLTTAGSRWHIAALRPGESPVESLAAAMQVLGSNGIEQTLLRSSLGLSEAVRQARLDASENVLVVVDQFEELFRNKVSRDESIAFVRLLLEAVRQSALPIYVIIVLRSEFFADCADFRGLPEALNDGVYLVPRMTRDQLRAAIENPAQIDGASISSSLVQRVLNDLYEHLDYLPVLQSALRRTWDGWRQSGVSAPIGLTSYDQVGGLESLDLHAEEVYERLQPPMAGVAKTLFQRLTEAGPDGPGIRRPTRIAELCEVAGVTFEDTCEVVARFREEMLLTATGVNPESVCDLPSESLMRQWRRLASWIAEEAGDAKFYRRLQETAARNKAGEASLLHGHDLNIAREWIARKQPREAWARRYGEGFHDVMQFVQISKRNRWGLFW